MNDESRSVEFASQDGKAQQLFMLYVFCAWFIFLGGHARWYSPSAGWVIESVLLAGFLLALGSKDIWIARAGVLRNEHRIAGVRVSFKEQDVPRDWWVQSRHSGAGRNVVIELCKGKSWEATALHEVLSGNGALGKKQRLAHDALRGDIAASLGIEDRGWERWPGQQERSAEGGVEASGDRARRTARRFPAPSVRSIFAGIVLFLLIPLVFIVALVMLHTHDEARLESKQPARPLPLIAWNGATLMVLDYTIGGPFNTPQCATDTSQGAHGYAYQTAGNCFRHLNPGLAGTPLLPYERVLVDRFDLGQHYRYVDWARPVCVGVKDGQIVGVAVHLFPSAGRAVDTMIEQDAGTTSATTSTAAQTRVSVDHRASEVIDTTSRRAEGQVLDVASSVSMVQGTKGGTLDHYLVVRGMREPFARPFDGNGSLVEDCPGESDIY